jgi:hypothetical protein
VILSVALQDVESQVAVVLSAVIRQPLQQPGASLCGDGIVSDVRHHVDRHRRSPSRRQRPGC